jgi:hypothetical protein
MTKHHLGDRQLQSLKPRKTPYADGGGVSFQVSEGKDGRINISGLFGFAAGAKSARRASPTKPRAGSALASTVRESGRHGILRRPSLKYAAAVRRHRRCIIRGSIR